MIRSIVPFLMLASLAAAQSRGTLHVTARIQGSVRVVFTAGGFSKTQDSAGSARMTVPVTREMIANPFVLRVVKANLESSSYTLLARLTPANSDHVWAIDNVDISDGTQRMISAAGTYGIDNRHVTRVSGIATDFSSLGDERIVLEIIPN